MTGALLAPQGTTTSWLHRVSPIPKLAWMLAGIVVVLASSDPLPMLVISGISLVVAASAGITRPLGRALLAFAPLAASIIVVQALFPVQCDPCTPVATLGPFTVEAEGVARGVVLALRIVALELVGFTVLLTIQPGDLFAGLRQLGVPRSVGFAAAMTLRLVPILERELAIVLVAQRARGLPASGPVALGRAVVPVVVAAVERVEQLTISLEARGFGIDGPRTSYREVAYGTRERAAAAAGLIATALGLIAAIAWWRVPPPALAAPVATAIVILAALVMVAVLVRTAVLVLRA